MENIVIIGAGGHGKEIAFLIKRLSQYNLVGFYDDSKIGQVVCNVPVISNIDQLELANSPVNAVLGIAEPKIKEQIIKRLSRNSNIRFPNLIDPKAELGINIELGIGNVVMTNATFTADIKVGNFNMFNIGSTVGHDVEIGSYNSIYPSVNLSGGTILSNKAELGVGTKVIQGITIGEGAIIGAGSVVINNIDKHEKVVGVPAKRIGEVKNES
ncbi:acetyltransferase [Candidatus Enterococcus mansonii]|uniref:PglD N-terminal domain-containing protein n=1 Tax=Candidatus Enterococcus mansonii TaxID=1834181 RepID=A0A242CDQ3_9ENTE|nr:acetyltransferase [Enterococcus sp. 4G2_DIV0659]OTO08248.1 hypothetical protein A5880_002518 [Enterococcus sp. 4G2_DIV0659]